MTDKEIIKALTCCQDNDDNSCRRCPLYCSGDCVRQLTRGARELIKRLKDVEPARRGHWIINSDGYYPQCSECMNEPQGRVMTDWCPNCGAKMGGEESEK